MTATTTGGPPLVVGLDGTPQNQLDMLATQVLTFARAAWETA